MRLQTLFNPTHYLADLRTLLVMSGFIPALYFMINVLAAELAYSFFLFVDTFDQTLLMTLDATLSFIILFFSFQLIYRINNIHHEMVIVSAAIVMFFDWAIKSMLLSSTETANYVLWYEINMALNDLIIAAIVIMLCRFESNLEKALEASSAPV